MQSDVALVTAIPCQRPSASRHATTDTLAATDRMLRRKLSVVDLRTSA